MIVATTVTVATTDHAAGAAAAGDADAASPTTATPATTTRATRTTTTLTTATVMVAVMPPVVAAAGPAPARARPARPTIREHRGQGAEGRSAEDEITGVSGSTRLEAKKQRRREGREAGRRRAPIVSEAEFLARRESVKREMVVRQRDDYTQIAVLEDSVLVEHYVARESQTSLIGNVYLGKVQNVLPSMEAAFIDIGAGRNAVLYAGEVDWSTLGNGKQRKIEDALSPGQTVLVQATKDPIGQKGARLTSQVSLPADTSSTCHAARRVASPASSPRTSGSASRPC